MTVKDPVVIRFTRQQVEDAQSLESSIIQDAKDAADAFWRLARHVYEFTVSESWLPLGYPTFKDWAIARGPKTYGYLQMHRQAWERRLWLERSGEPEAAQELNALGPEKVQALLSSLNVLERRDEGNPLKRDKTPEATPDPVAAATEIIRSAIDATQMPELRAVAAQVIEGKHVSHATVPVSFFDEKQRGELGMSDPAMEHRKVYLSWSYLEDDDGHK